VPDCLPAAGIGPEFIALDAATRQLIERQGGAPRQAAKEPVAEASNGTRHRLPMLSLQKEMAG
jgi:hypothetical protein